MTRLINRLITGRFSHQVDEIPKVELSVDDIGNGAGLKDQVVKVLNVYVYEMQCTACRRFHVMRFTEEPQLYEDELERRFKMQGGCRGCRR